MAYRVTCSLEGLGQFSMRPCEEVTITIRTCCRKAPATRASYFVEFELYCCVEIFIAFS